LQNPHHKEILGKRHANIKFEPNQTNLNGTLNRFTKETNYDMALHIASEAMPPNQHKAVSHARRKVLNTMQARQMEGMKTKGEVKK